MLDRSGLTRYYRFMSSQTTTASFEPDDWKKVFAVLGALAALGVLPKKWGTPIAVIGLLLALRD